MCIFIFIHKFAKHKKIDVAKYNEIKNNIIVLCTRKRTITQTIISFPSLFFFII